MARDNIEAAIEESDISSRCDPLTGDCISVASAIVDVFGGDILVFYQSGERKKVMHAVVEVDGNCYDGTGMKSFEMLLETTAMDAENFGVQQELFSYEQDVSGFRIYDERVKQAVVEDLEVAVSE